MNKEIWEKEIWNKQTIQTRSGQLANQFIKMFPYYEQKIIHQGDEWFEIKLSDEEYKNHDLDTKIVYRSNKDLVVKSGTQIYWNTELKNEDVINWWNWFKNNGYIEKIPNEDNKWMFVKDFEEISETKKDGHLYNVTCYILGKEVNSYRDVWIWKLGGYSLKNVSVSNRRYM